MHNAGYLTNNLPRRHPHPSAPPLTACFGGWESLLLFHQHFFPKSLPPLLSRRPHHPFVPLFSSSSLSAPNSTTLLSETAGAANGTVLPRLIATLVLRDWCWSPRASSSCGDESLTSRWTSHIVCMPSSVPFPLSFRLTVALWVGPFFLLFGFRCKPFLIRCSPLSLRLLW